MKIRRILSLVLVLMLIAGIALAEKVTTTGSVNMRSKPGLSYTIINTVPKGVTLEELDWDTDDRDIIWYKVKYGGKTGWISSTYAKEQGGWDDDDDDDEGTEVTLIYGSTNLRKSPSLSGTLLTSITKGTTVKYTETAVDDRGVMWFKVTYKNKTGWISSKYTDAEVSLVVAATKGSTYLRSSYSINAKILTTLSKGEEAKYLGVYKFDDRNVKWYKVRYNGKTGWVSSKYTVVRGE